MFACGRVIVPARRRPCDLQDRTKDGFICVILGVPAAKHALDGGTTVREGGGSKILIWLIPRGQVLNRC